MRHFDRKKILIRADASREIGIGHVMRCLALAQELKRYGAEVHLAYRVTTPWLETKMRNMGIDAHALSTFERAERQYKCDCAADDNSPWLNVPWQADASQSIQLLEVLGEVDLVVVDHYGIDARWHEELRGPGRNLLVIDDLANREYAADWLIDVTLGRERIDYDPWIPPSCKALLGPNFALLRPEFAGIRPQTLQSRTGRGLQRILVSMGGTDPFNLTSLVLEGLEQVPGNFEVDVVLDGSAPALPEVRGQVRESTQRIRVLESVSAMAPLMARADLAIGAAGGTSWERCVLGLPSLLIVTEDNQRKIAQELDKAGAAIVLGHRNIATPETLSTAVTMLYRNPELLFRLSKTAASITDGRGAKRVARLIMEA